MRPSDWLQFEMYGNSFGDWLTAIGLVVVGIGSLVLVKSVGLRRLERVAARTKSDLDDLLLDLLRSTRFFFFAFIALTAAAQVLELTPRAQRFTSLVAVIALLVQLALWGGRLIGYGVSRYALARGMTDGASRMTVGAVEFLARMVMWAIILMVALDNLGIQVTALITGLGIGGIAIALAVQNILGDLFAALAIVVDKPFVVGDTIAVDTLSGKVEDIGLKTTRLRAPDGEQLIIANADLLRSRIRNLNRMDERRVQFMIPVARDTSVAVLQGIPPMLREIVEAQDNVRFDRAHLRGLGAGSIDFEVVYVVLSADYTFFMDTQQRVLLEALRRLSAAGVELAFPTQRIVVERPAEIPGETDAQPSRRASS